MTGYETVSSDAAIVVDRRTRDLGMDFATVASARQAKQLASIYLKENRLEATAEITLRPRWQMLKPGDWIRWNSARYGNRTYIVTAGELLSLDSDGPRNKRLSLQERNASIYDGVPLPPIVIPYPPGKPVYLQEVQNFQVAAVLAGSGGKTMPAIHASWNAIDDVTVVGVELRYWPTNDPDNVSRDRTEDDESFALLTDGVVGETEYAVQTRLITSPRRVVSWSAPKTVTTLEGSHGGIYPIDLDDLADDVKDLQDWLGSGVRDLWDMIEQYSQLQSDQNSLNFFDKQTRVGKWSALRRRSRPS